MENLLKRHFWIIKVLGLTAAVGLASSAATTKFGAAKLFITSDDGSDDGGESDGESDSDSDSDGDDDDGPRSRGADLFDASESTKGGTDRRQRTASEKTKMLTTLLANNLFCPTCAPEISEGLEADVGAPLLNEEGEQIGGIKPGEQRTSLPFKLVVTMESSDPSFSQATIFDTEAGSVSPYWPGDQVRAGVYLAAVEHGLIHLQNQSVLEYLELGAEIATPKKSKSTVDETPTKPTKPTKGAIPGADEAIKCDSEDSCTIERAFIDQILANPAALMKQARVLPAVVDGETRGFKFAGIRSGSLPKLLGLSNGDVLTSVNGKDIRSIDDATALYTKLRNAPNLSINVERKGKQITKEITIR